MKTLGKLTLVLGGLANAALFAQEKNARPSMNPDLGVNLLSSYSQSRQGKDASTGGFSFDEAELHLSSIIDPYLRGVLLLSVHAEDEHEQEGEEEDPAADATEEHESSYSLVPEEAYLETTSLPGVTLKAGRFFAALGRHNSLHAHAFPFLDAPLIHQRLLGPEALAEAGLSAAALLPIPWFSEITLEALQGSSRSLFASSQELDGARVYRWRNLFELTDETTFDIGLSGARGNNAYATESSVGGADITWKWRSNESAARRALVLSLEYLSGHIPDRPEDARLRGYAGWIQYQWNRHFWVQARSEQASNPEESGIHQSRQSALLAFLPSEFSSLRLQYDRLRTTDEDDRHSITLQSIISMGAHPAHTY